MKVHTELDEYQIGAALIDAQDKKLIAADIEFAQFEWESSITHSGGYLIQLGSAYGDRSSLLPDAVNQYGKPQNRRRIRHNSQNDLRFAATWYEWGWFMLEIFHADLTARFGGLGKSSFGYTSEEDFHAKTRNKFRTYNSLGRTL
jgi:hypothetical protein